MTETSTDEFWSQETVRALILIARNQGACDTETRTISRVFADGVDELTQHLHAPYWCYWMLTRTIEDKHAFEASGVCYAAFLEAIKPIVLREPLYAVTYAIMALKSRWPEAEPSILTEPHCAYLYATKVIKGPWPEAEESLSKDPFTLESYKRYLADLEAEKSAAA